MKRIDSRLAVISLLALILLVCACGKKGDPVPQEHRYMFSWGESSADITNDCLLIVAQMEGAYENVDGFLLEVEATTDEICLTCPFKPGEVTEIRPTSSSDGLFSFQYCPEVRADSYRWRLAARNMYRGLPHVLTPVKLVKRPF